MATLVDTGFEAANVAAEFNSVTDTQGRLTLSTTNKFRGAKGFYDPGSPSAVAWGLYNAAALEMAFRFAIKVDALPTVAAHKLVRHVQATKPMAVQIGTNGKLQCLSAAAVTSTATAFTLGTWYIVQGYFDAFANPALVHARLYDSDGNAIDAEISKDDQAGAGVISTGIRVGNDNGTTLSTIVTIDSLKVTSAKADHPLGMPSPDSVVTKFGTQHGVVFSPHTGLWLPTD